MNIIESYHMCRCHMKNTCIILHAFTDIDVIHEYIGILFSYVYTFLSFSCFVGDGHYFPQALEARHLLCLQSHHCACGCWEAAAGALDAQTQVKPLRHCCDHKQVAGSSRLSHHIYCRNLATWSLKLYIVTQNHKLFLQIACA